METLKKSRKKNLVISNRYRHRIRAEEIYRAQVQKEITKEKESKTTVGKGLEFLNSAFFIWLMSSVFLTFITWSYSTWQAKTETEKQKSERAEKLRTELLFRTADLRLELRGLKEDEFNVKTSVESLLAPSGAARAIVHEFADRSTESLLYEFAETVRGDKDSETHANQARIQLGIIIFNSKAPGSNLDNLKEFTRAVKELRVSIWRTDKRNRSVIMPEEIN